MQTIKTLLKNYEYPGRGIILGLNKSKTNFFLAYFITGRSENSKNRILIEDEFNNIKTRLFKKQDTINEDLIIYTAVTKFKDLTIISNGSQTDTILNGIKNNKTFVESLKDTQFEEDPPIYTPRISAMLNLNNKTIKYEMSIIKTDEKNSNITKRFYFEYDNPLGEKGHIIHTYKPKENNLTHSYYGEPEEIIIPQDFDEFTNSIWDSLNEKNKISLFTKSIEIETKKEKLSIINKNYS